MNERTVFTRLGRGRIVYELRDGSLVVEFPHGGGNIFRPEEIFDPVIERAILNPNRRKHYGQAPHRQIQG